MAIRIEEAHMTEMLMHARLAHHGVLLRAHRDRTLQRLARIEMLLQAYIEEDKKRVPWRERWSGVRT
jgi:hypothetical protein